MSNPSEPTELTRDELAEQVRRLSAENANLRSATGTTGGEPPLDTMPLPTKGRQRWRAVLAVLIIAVATILSPVAVVTGWARLQLTDQQAFLQTFAPLASDPQVQQAVSTRVVAEINNAVDIEGLANELFTAIGQLDLPPRAKSAVQLLEAPAVSGVQSLIQNTVNNFVQSDAFEAVWTQAITSAHQALTAVATNDLSDPNRALTVSDSGEVAIQLGPIIAAVKQQLVDRGLTLANNIPAINKTIVIAQTDAVPKIRTWYAVATAVGYWLPFLVLALFVVGVLVARNRRQTTIVAALCLAGVMLLVVAGIAIGRVVFVNAVAPSQISAGAAEAIYRQALVFARGTVLACIAAGIIVAAVAWFGGPWAPAVGGRKALDDGAAALRRAGDDRGLSTGRVGVWIGAHGTVIRTVVAVVAAAVVVLTRPATVSLIVWTTLIALVVLLVLKLLERPAPTEAVEATAPPEPAPVA